MIALPYLSKERYIAYRTIEALKEGDAREFIDRCAEYPGSSVSFLTLAPSMAQGSISPQALQYQFRGIYIKMLRACFGPAFGRPSKRDLHPLAIAYIDEPSDDIKFRHIHAMIHVREEIKKPYEKFIRPPLVSADPLAAPTKMSRLKRAWVVHHPRGKVDVQWIEGDVRSVQSYCSKSWERQQLLNRFDIDSFSSYRSVLN